MQKFYLERVENDKYRGNKHESRDGGVEVDDGEEDEDSDGHVQPVQHVAVTLTIKTILIRFHKSIKTIE